MSGVKWFVCALALCGASISVNGAPQVQLPFYDGNSYECFQNSDDTPTHGRHDVVVDGKVVQTNVVSSDAQYTVYDLDFGVTVGTILVAPVYGVYTHGDNPDGYGWYGRIVMPGGDNWAMIAHLSGHIASNGQMVAAGQPVAYSGGEEGAPGAGTSTGPHVHFGVHSGDGTGTSQPMEVWAYERNTGKLQFFKTGKQGSSQRDITCYRQQPEGTGDGYDYESRPIGQDFSNFTCRMLSGSNGVLCWQGNPMDCLDGEYHVRYYKNGHGAMQSESVSGDAVGQWCVKDTGQSVSITAYLEGGYGVGGGLGDDGGGSNPPPTQVNLRPDLDIEDCDEVELPAGTTIYVGQIVCAPLQIKASGGDVMDHIGQGKEAIESNVRFCAGADCDTDIVKFTADKLDTDDNRTLQEVSLFILDSTSPF